MTFLALVGIAALGWYAWVAVLGYKACRRGGHTAAKAARWAAVWPVTAHMNIKNSYR